MAIDLNCDMGESFGAYVLGADAEIMPHISSANIAAGFHAGDPLVMARTVALAVSCGVAIGAHPGYPDLAGFGRRDMACKPEEVEAMVLYQVAAVAGFAQAAGSRLHHVKPHGALYNLAARDMQLAAAIARAVSRFDPSLKLVGLCGSEPMRRAAEAAGIAFVAEAFAERGYCADGSLVPRGSPGAIIDDPQRAAGQALAIAEGRLTSVDGKRVMIHAATVCIHGDSPHALDVVRAVRAAMDAAGIGVARP